MKNNKSYSSFFKKATGNEPFPYQVAFQQRPITPFAQLEGPTGVGKTETIVCDWLYAVVSNLSNTPSRLAIVSPLRTLVEQTHKRIQTIVERLNLEAQIGVHILMGGEVDNEWDLDRVC